ncbi:hypothetical protein BDZ45DRAFT_732923 [Acephala macrosclerotiorum]|nr:hypothetical protein BDZ45DRAFT_732923 [Acephala macrosclerotiorum]
MAGKPRGTPEHFFTPQFISSLCIIKPGNMDYQDFIWKETSPSQYERDIDDAEQFYTSLAKAWEGAGHTFFAITSCIGAKVTLPGGMDLEQLDEKIDNVFEHAWKRLRYDHPILAASVVVDSSTKKCNKVYKWPCKKSQRVALQFSTAETASIIGKCKSVEQHQHTFHAAIALALRDLQAPTSEARPASISLRFSRHLVVGTVIPSAIVAKQKREKQDREEFPAALKQVKAYAQTIKIDQDYLSNVPSLFLVVTPPFPSKLPPVPSPNPAPAVNLPSLGITDHIF